MERIAQSADPSDTELLAYFDPFDPSLNDDPYTCYARARERAAVCRGPYGMAVVTRHDAVSAALRDPRLGHGNATSPNRVFSFLGLDPPRHGPLRRLAAHAFTPKAIQALGARTARIADAVLDGTLAHAAVTDLLADFAYPVSLRVVCDIFGLPEEDHSWIREQTPPIGRLLDPPFAISADDMARARHATAGFIAYLRDQISRKRRSPGPDLLSELIALVDAEGSVTSRDLIPLCALLVMAGYETTANLIGNGLLALLTCPGALDQARRFAQRGALTPTAVNELARYDSPIQITFRTATSEAVIAGTRLRAGTPVALLLGSANHDPRVHTHPERLDLSRTPNPHMSFGAGIHYCLGAPLARLEAGIALGRLLTRTRHLEADTDSPRHKNITAAIRGLHALPVIPLLR